MASLALGLTVAACGGDDSPPGDADGGPGMDGSLPGDDGSLPGDDGSLPGDDGSLPGDDGSLPGDDGSLPGDDGGAPADDGGAPADDGGPAMMCTMDGDCNDRNACTRDRCRTGSCANTVIDADGDTHSPDSLSCGTDCDDRNADVNPDQTMFFAMGYGGGAGGAPSFDYDCNGTEERRWTTVFRVCMVDPSGGCAGGGWLASSIGDAIPRCGQRATWVECARGAGGTTCAPRMSDRTQECR